jgi:hypothetical protein
MAQDQLFSLAEERRRREKALDYTTASVEPSGFETDLPTQERARLYVEGQLSWHEFCDLQR